jgi:hypothetical protein
VGPAKFLKFLLADTEFDRQKTFGGTWSGKYLTNQEAIMITPTDSGQNSLVYSVWMSLRRSNFAYVSGEVQLHAMR